MALTLDTRIPLLAVDPNFAPSKAINAGIDSVLNQRSKELSNRLEQMKADYEEQKAKRTAQAAAQLDAWSKAMQAGTPAVMGQPTPATPDQYGFGGPDPRAQSTAGAGLNIADMLTGRIDPQHALSLLTQQPTVTPGKPAIPAQEITPAVPGRTPTPEEYMRQLAQIQMGQGDVAGAVDTYKALGGYAKDTRPPTDGHASVAGKRIKLASDKFPVKGEAGVVVFDPSTNRSYVQPLGVEFTDEDVANERLSQGQQRINVTIGQNNATNDHHKALLNFNRMKWDSDAEYRKARTEKAVFAVSKAGQEAEGVDPEVVDTLARIYRSGGTVSFGRGGMASAVGRQVMRRVKELADEEGIGVGDMVAGLKIAKAELPAYSKFKYTVEQIEKASKQAEGHLAVAEKALDKLPNMLGGRIPLVNSAVNTLDRMTGNPEAIAAAKALKNFTMEYEKVIIGAYGAQGLSVHGQKDAEKLLDINMSPEQRSAIIANMRADMAIAEQYARGSLKQQAADIHAHSGGAIDVRGGKNPPAPTGGAPNAQPKQPDAALAAKQAKLDSAVEASRGNTKAMADLRVYARKNNLRIKGE